LNLKATNPKNNLSLFSLPALYKIDLGGESTLKTLTETITE